jgi:ribosomal protein S4
MKKSNKPFHLKKKLLYQTKLNIWKWDQGILSKKLKGQKWGFLKLKKNKTSTLDSFRFRPFLYNSSRDNLKNNFRNNLYLRKIIRLKYARLKNKEFHKLYKESRRDYRSLIIRLASRLDVIVFNILQPKSIFQVRQFILHGKVLVNGLKVKTPSISLKVYDVISFRFSDLSNIKFLYRNNTGRIEHIADVGYCIYNHSYFRHLDKKDQDSLLIELGGVLEPNHKEVTSKFLNDIFNQLFVTNTALDGMSEKKIYSNKIKNPKKVLPLKEFVRVFKNTLFNKKFKPLKENIRNKFLFNSFLNSLDEEEAKNGMDNEYHFFTRNYNFRRVEVFIKGDYLDMVFLGAFEDINIPNKDKYLLHYLY